jgi:hypothetical protein
MAVTKLGLSGFSRTPLAKTALVVEASITENLSLGVSQSADSVADGNIVQAVNPGFVVTGAVDAVGEVNVEVAFNSELSANASADASADASVLNNSALDTIASAQAVSYSSTEIPILFNVSLLPEKSIEASVIDNISMGVSVVGEAVSSGIFNVSISADSVLSSSAIADAIADANLSISNEVACAVIAEAIVYADLEFGQLLNVITDGNTLSGDVVTPSGRTYTVSAEIRLEVVASESRIING